MAAFPSDRATPDGVAVRNAGGRATPQPAWKNSAGRAPHVEMGIVLDGGVLTFSTDLLAQPRRFREEVIVHELVHLLVPNHGKLFRALMRAELKREEDPRMSCRAGALA